MSADRARPGQGMQVALLWGLIGFTGVLYAENAETPDLEFLEYLGSWEESDEDWVLFAADNEEPVASQNNGDDPAPQGEEKLAELDDES